MLLALSELGQNMLWERREHLVLPSMYEFGLTALEMVMNELGCAGSTGSKQTFHFMVCHSHFGNFLSNC